MTGDIEKRLYDVADSTKMKGFGDKLERIINDTEKSVGLWGARPLSDEELDLVAGGVNYGDLKDRVDNAGANSKKGGGPIPKSGLIC